MLTEAPGRVGPAVALFGWRIKLSVKLPYRAGPLAPLLNEVLNDAAIVRKRRSLDDGEIERLLKNAPAPRKDTYKVLILTGLRRSEAASLEDRNIRMKSPAPFIRLRADQTKTKKEQEIPLHSELIEFFSSRSGEPTERIFGSIPDVATLKKDLEAAEIEFETEDGRIDIHSLRHTFCRLVCDAEPDIKKAAKLTRHDDPMVLLKFYRNLKAVEGTETMRSVVFPVIESKPQRATGTDGAPLNSAVPRMSQITRIVLHKLAQLGIDSDEALRVASQRLSASSHDLASSRLPEPPTPDILSESRPSTQVD